MSRKGLIAHGHLVQGGKGDIGTNMSVVQTCHPFAKNPVLAVVQAVSIAAGQLGVGNSFPTDLTVTDSCSFAFETNNAYFITRFD